MAEDWRDDPFVDPDDPAARERAERRAKREAKRGARDAKRKEKEAKKAAAAPPPKPVPAAPAEPPKPPRTPEQEFWDEDPEPEPLPAAEAKPADPKPEQAREPEPAPPSEPQASEPEPQPEEPEPRRDGATAAAAAGAGAAAAASAPAPADPLPTPPPEPAIEQAWDREPPSTPDADIWGDEADLDEPKAVGGGGGGGRPAGGVSRVPGPPKRRVHPLQIIGLILFFLVFWFVYALFQPFHSDGTEEVRVTIPKGASVSEVGDLLLEKGVIDDPILPISGSTLFQMRATLSGKRSELYAGQFTLTESMSYGSALDALSVPPQKRTVAVTIPEGLARSQAAQLVEEAGVPGSYTKASVKSKFLNPAEYGGKGAKSLEGFLFPNTFELKPKAPAADLVELQLKDFKRQIKKVNMRYAKSKNLTVFDVLIIASMIEDEAGVPGQRKLVASVIYNRLKEGRPLGIDAVTRFYTGNYTDPLTESELTEDSPYNTRENIGLPPGPINSPGLEAIRAAANPAKTNYVYYVTAPHTCGKLAFSANEAKWEKDVEAYNAAREEAGGQNPDSCGE